MDEGHVEKGKTSPSHAGTHLKIPIREQVDGNHRLNNRRSTILYSL